MSDTAPSSYLLEPTYDVAQEYDLDDVGEKGLRAARLLSQPSSPRDYKQALDWAREQIVQRDRDWFGLCQMFCRTSYGLGGGFGSAFAQWLGMPTHAKHIESDPETAPLGSMLFSKGDSPFGHIMIAARPFSDGTPAAISTDALRPGWPDKVSRRGLLEAWGHTYLGWGSNLNGVDIRYRHPAPVDDKPYEALATARDRLGNALDDLRTARDTAKEQEDWRDRDRIQAQIVVIRAEKQRLTELYETLRRS